MRRPSLLYASPFPPQQSGIADYSGVLVPVLAEVFDLTLYVPPDCPPPDEAQVRGRYAIRRHGEDAVNPSEYDFRIYQMGNNPWFHGYIYEMALSYPGIVVLHEVVLFYLVVGLYQDRHDFLDRMYRIGGPRAIQAVKECALLKKPLLQYDQPERVPLASELLHSGNRFLVHSRYASQRIAAVAPEATVDIIPQVVANTGAPAAVSREEVRRRLGLEDRCRLVASFGFVAPTKLNHIVCRAVRRLHLESPDAVFYLMAGAGNYVDEFVDSCVHVTGFTDEADFESYLQASDLVINLRWPTMGETSSALLRAMDCAKPCVVSRLGWFAELPDTVVLKLDIRSPDEVMEEEVYQALKLYLQHPDPFRQMGLEAAAYVKRLHSVSAVATKLAALVRDEQDHGGAPGAAPQPVAHTG